ncbi:MAG: hypothetical protein ACREO5_07950 [Candidatus Binatia bacterium]
MASKFGRVRESRIYQRRNAALKSKQDSDNCGNHVAGFILHVMNPVRYVGSSEYFDAQREKLNRVLAFSGLTVGEDEGIRAVTAVRTIGEAKQRAGILRNALIERCDTGSGFYDLTIFGQSAPPTRLPH